MTATSYIFAVTSRGHVTALQEGWFSA